MAISMLKIRRPLGRLIFNMGIAIPGKTVFLIETAPWWLMWFIHPCSSWLFCLELEIGRRSHCQWTNHESYGEHHSVLNYNKEWNGCIITVTWQWARWLLKSPASRLFIQPFIRRRSKKTSKLRVTDLFWGEFTGDRWIPLTMGQ